MKYNLVQEFDGIKIELKIEGDGRRKELSEIVLDLQDTISYRLNDVIRNKMIKEDNK